MKNNYHNVCLRSTLPHACTDIYPYTMEIDLHNQTTPSQGHLIHHLGESTKSLYQTSSYLYSHNHPNCHSDGRPVGSVASYGRYNQSLLA